jgi:hypothetical protein
MKLEDGGSVLFEEHASDVEKHSFDHSPPEPKTAGLATRASLMLHGLDDIANLVAKAGAPKPAFPSRRRAPRSVGRGLGGVLVRKVLCGRFVSLPPSTFVKDVISAAEVDSEPR